MNRSRLAFLLIVGAAVILVGAGVVLDQLDNSSTSTNSGDAEETNNTTAVTLTLAVSPVGADWIEAAGKTYNAERRRVNGRVVEIRVTQQDSLPVWNSPGAWSARDHPVIWIPEMAQAVTYAHEVGMDFSIRQPSLASTVMLWGAPSDRAQVLTGQFDTFNWTSVQQASAASLWEAIGGESDWRFFKPGFAQPDRYMSGVAALLIATAEFHGQPDLNAALLNDPALIKWLKPVFESVPNFASLGVYPAQAIATRGTSVADVALLPENEWLVNYKSLTTKVGALTLVYPDYQVWFDFPFAVWDGAEITDQERAAADDFLNFLLSDQQQRQAAAFGLRGADGVPAEPTLFDEAASAGVSAIRPPGERIQLPSRNDITPFVNRDWTAF
ncbi:MAG: substrate-binding domain-containing protein [Anaerolineae bacterium]|nr:substrate-binding domain-containing protein [Anaerolineae bacterium]